MFSQVCVCSTFGGEGGTQSQVWMWGGTPSQVWMVGGEYPIPGLDGGGGVPHPRSGWWYPIPGLDGGGVPHPRSGWWGGTPSQVWMVGGYPPARSEWWGVPPTMTGWGTPPPPPHQHSKHLLFGGRYASCVHAGGLPCWISIYSTVCQSDLTKQVLQNEYLTKNIPTNML